MKTTVVNIRHQREDVYIGRPRKANGIPDPPARGCFGNPFVMKTEAERGEVVRRFELYFLNRIETDEAFREAVLRLRGKKLGCFCSPKPCHGDVIVKWLESHEEGGSRAHT